MFTGIVEAVGEIARVEPANGDFRLYVRTEHLDLSDVKLGDSIATNGVCLTVVSLSGDGFWADVSAETIACSTFSGIQVGQRVNLEKALTPTTRLGGHLVSGHVDGVGQVRSRQEDGRSVRIHIEAPAAIAKYIAAKGSICVDGISLTVNSVAANVFGLNIVPHTALETTVGLWRPGTRVNLEVDMLARYLERLLLAQSEQQPGSDGINLAFLAEHGFLKR